MNKRILVRYTRSLDGFKTHNNHYNSRLKDYFLTDIDFHVVIDRLLYE